MRDSGTPLVPCPPIAAHEEPSQRARRSASTLPAALKNPAATTPPSGSVVMVDTPGTDVPALRPVPSADHDEPFQRAMALTAAPPMVINLPPAMTSPLGSAASASTL